MKELEQADELNMRQYVMKYIIPLLTEGMIDVWKVGPLDPVDYLAEYIFKKSGEQTAWDTIHIENWLDLNNYK